MTHILIADPDPTTQSGLRDLFDNTVLNAEVVQDGRDALAAVLEHDIDIVIAELKLPGIDGLTLLREIHRQRPETAVILLTAFGSVEDAVSAMREGAADFLSKPYTSDQIRLSVERSVERLQLVKENQQLREALDDRLSFDNMIATVPQMQRILKTVRAVASTRTTVLLTGESGTGKTLLARAIHKMSPRQTGPFIEVNCGALPESLLESELFGHVRGAFTGAVRDRPGKFEAATGGTIFLDEIGTSTAAFQIKLLRVLQDRIIERVGDTKTLPVDVRIVLATNLDLEQAVREGRFREDLYYRINVVSVEMPPLRERSSDIPYLAQYFLRRLNEEIGKAITGFSPEAMDQLMSAPFPGNVRQLENVIERAVVLCEGTLITIDDLPPDLARGGNTEPLELVPSGAHLMPLKRAMEVPEKIIIERALAAHDGNRQETATSLAINRSTLFNKMRKFGLL